MKTNPPYMIASLVGGAAVAIIISTSLLITHPGDPDPSAVRAVSEETRTEAVTAYAASETSPSRDASETSPAPAASETEETAGETMPQVMAMADNDSGKKAFGFGNSDSSGKDSSSAGAASSSAAADDRDLTVSVNREGPGDDVRSFYTDTKSAKDTVLMIYMIGSNLESERGAATNDLREIAAAKTGEHFKVVLEAGGSKNWFSKDIQGTEPGRYELRDGKFTFLESAGKVSMTSRKTLQEFLSFTKENYPADRYILIFWDHGGGTRGGFGLDETQRKVSLSLMDISAALKESGMKFDVIGFDACLMATLETAYVLEPFADFMIASEEYEPSEGWYYTDFVSMLAEDPACDSIDLGTSIATGYLEKSKSADITLSMLDLRGIPDLYASLDKYLAGITGEIRTNNKRFQDYSLTRDNTKEFCDGQIDQIDIVDFLARNDFEEGKEELAVALGTCLRVFGVGEMPGANGIAMYLPYHEIGQYNKTRRMLSEAGFDRPVESYDYLLSVMSGGQAKKAPAGIFNRAKNDSSAEDKVWQDPEVAENFEYFIVPENLPVTESGLGFDLVQPQEFWDNITDIQLQCVQINDDITEFVDLGTDYMWSQTEDGTWHVDYLGIWMSLDGQPVCYRSDRIYYGEGGAGYIYTGRIPVRLNGEHMAELVVRCDPTDEGMAGQAGVIQGVRLRDEETGTVERGIRPLSPGDVLELVYEVYTFTDGENYQMETQVRGEPIHVTETHQPELAYTELDDSWYAYFGVLFDIYQRIMSTDEMFRVKSKDALYR